MQVKIRVLSCHEQSGNSTGAVVAGSGAGALLQPLTEDNCHLEFEVKWKRQGGRKWKGWGDTSWEPESNLNCDKLLARFVQELRRCRKVPLPGQHCTSDLPAWPAVPALPAWPAHSHSCCGALPGLPITLRCLLCCCACFAWSRCIACLLLCLGIMGCLLCLLCLVTLCKLLYLIRLMPLACHQGWKFINSEQ